MCTVKGIVLCTLINCNHYHYAYCFEYYYHKYVCSVGSIMFKCKSMIIIMYSICVRSLYVYDSLSCIPLHLPA